MFEDIQLIYTNVRILKFLSLLYDKTWRRYACLVPSTFLLFTQFYYMFMTHEGIVAIIRNSYILVLWFNTLLRAYLMIYDDKKYQDLIANLEHHFHRLNESKDLYIKSLLVDVNSMGKAISKGNLFLGMLTCIGFTIYPFFADERVLPFGMMIPGISEYRSPCYEILYIFQMILTPMGCCMYIPYTTLIVSFIMFSIVLCKTLQHRLRCLNSSHNNHFSIHQQILDCIHFQQEIISFIETVNSLTTLIFMAEFMAFGTLLCALLFLLIIVDSTAQAIIVCAYITMIFSQILALYWYANELKEQNLQIAYAAYETEWFTYPIPVQKNIQLLILRAQKPCSIKVGNMYLMTLELFQSLLNASYSYFTLLKRVYA